VVTTERDGRVVTAIPKGGFAAEIANIRDQHGDLPVLMAGMVGSTLGWQTAPYVPTPATLATLSVNLLTVAPHTRIIPGVRTSGARA
ncbi:2-dehydro-3-deoxygalactonokinase, partial [Acinetobacter baumannii]